MDSDDIFELELSSGDSREKRDPTEWLDLKSRVAEENFRKLSADLERRRTRRFLQHEEEERKVVLELNKLQRDRLRFEREKQLRQRNSFSSSRERGQSLGSENRSLGEVSTKLTMNEKSFGASASLAFDPAVAKSFRPQRRASKEQVTNYGSARKASKASSASYGFPYIDEGDVQRFHKLCKSASKSECRRWGAAWFYAKKEQDVADDSKKRWTLLLLKSEKEKMRILSAKGVAFLDLGFDGKSSRDIENNINRKAFSGRENRRSFYGPKNLSSCFDQKKESGDSRERVELSKEDKLTFHKAFSSGFREYPELANNEKLNFHKAFSLPPAEELSKDVENPKRTALHKTSQPAAASVDCKNIITLFKESAQDRKVKRCKKSRLHSEGIEDIKTSALPRMPAIPELDEEESSSSSSSGEKSENFPRRKRAVCFLPDLTSN